VNRAELVAVGVAQVSDVKLASRAITKTRRVFAGRAAVGSARCMKGIHLRGRLRRKPEGAAVAVACGLTVEGCGDGKRARRVAVVFTAYFAANNPHNHRMRPHRPTRTPRYLWQLPDWPNLTFDAAALAAPLAQVHRAQGMLAGRMAELGLAQRDQATLQVLTQEVITTSAIEGERLDLDAVRSSVARKLGLDIGALAPSDRHVDGVVDVVLDATRNFDQPLTARAPVWLARGAVPHRLQRAHTHHRGRMAHRCQRPHASRVRPIVGGRKCTLKPRPPPPCPRKPRPFLTGLKPPRTGDAIIKAGLAHLWLVTLHPFDDGNGRLSRAVGDMALARAEGTHQRFYSFSAQIQRERKDYYDQLEATQKGPLDVTPWLHWFLGCLLRAVQGADATLAGVLDKAQFWQRWAGTLP
jgi:Fic family protein